MVARPKRPRKALETLFVRRGEGEMTLEWGVDARRVGNRLKPDAAYLWLLRPVEYLTYQRRRLSHPGQVL